MFFGRGLRLGRIGGIVISVDYSWFIIFGLLIFLLGIQFPVVVPGQSAVAYWSIAVITSLLFFASVLAHELSHAVVARRNGIPINSIMLFLLGGVAQMEDEPPTAWIEFKMAVAGPVMSVLVGLLFLALFFATGMLTGSRLLMASFGYLALINIILAVFNLLPGYPMDGGRVFRALLWHVTGDLLKATRIASITGQTFGWAFILLGVGSLFLPALASLRINGIWFAIIGWFLISAARGSYQQLVVRESLRKVPVDAVMNTGVETVPANISVDRLVMDYFMRESPSVLAVAEDDRLLGTVSVADVQKLPREEWAGRLVREIMQPLKDDLVVHPGDDAWDAANRLAREDDGGQVFVTDHDHLEGTITRGSLARWLQMHPRMRPSEGT